MYKRGYLVARGSRLHSLTKFDKDRRRLLAQPWLKPNNTDNVLHRIFARKVDVCDCDAIILSQLKAE